MQMPIFLAGVIANDHHFADSTQMPLEFAGANGALAKWAFVAVLLQIPLNYLTIPPLRLPPCCRKYDYKYHRIIWECIKKTFFPLAHVIHH
jgi:hypothetical protein